MPNRTIAERTRIVNITILAVSISLLVLCLVRGLWFPAAAFTLLIVSNGYQLLKAQRSQHDDTGS